ncbi:tyrosine-type recombinase/integrase [Cloacibacillus porcorum]
MAEKDRKKSGFIFPNPKTGKPYKNYNGSWEALLKDAEISNYRWDDMRHDFASRLVIMGVDLNTVRELPGYSEIKVT